MAFPPGARLGVFEILEHLGADEAGDRYKASDTRLNRTVALKVLSASLTSGPEIRERVEREARTIASLNHPHICKLHDIGHDDGHDFLVTEYVEGGTLATRLKRGKLPLDEALRMAAETADALDAAHAQGVVHRGLNPSNIVLTKSGTKLVDFGLGNWRSPFESPSSFSVVPTQVVPSTIGVIAGAVEYMAPEQLEGHEADARTDIFTLGAIVYEAVTGKKAFEGKTRTILIASILTADPDPIPDAPAALDHIIRRCVAKVPDDRWQTAHDLAMQLRWIAGGGEAAVPPTVAARQRKWERMVLMVAAGFVAFSAVLAMPAVDYFRAAGPEPFEYRVPLTGLRPADTAISPNGRRIAAVVVDATTSALYVRPTGAVTSRRLQGTEGAAQPFWSPDSRYIAFVADGKLKKVEADGGPVQDVTAVADFSGGAWSARGEGLGTILFGSSKGLFRVSAEGGTAMPVTTAQKPETGHFWPDFLSDGDHYVYLAWSGNGTNRALFSGSLKSPDKPTRLMPAESNAAYVPGYLLFHREATLFAQPFDERSLKPVGDAVRVAGGISFSQEDGRGDFDASQEGTLLYFQGERAAARGGGRGGGRAGIITTQLGWLSRTGSVEVLGDQGPYGDWDVSFDDKLVAITREETTDAGSDIYLIDQRGVPRQVTYDPADDLNPVFSPDGSRIAFTSFRKGNADIYIKDVDGAAGSETPFLETSANEFVEAWSRDGHIVYLVEHDNVHDIWARPVSGDGEAFPVVQGPFDKNEPQVSFDGKWLAYAAETRGTFQVYVTSFPKHEQTVQISKDGGGQPRWRKDGRELFYRDPSTGAIVVVGMTAIPDGKIEPGAPQVLTALGTTNAVAVQNPRNHRFSVSPSGERFLTRVINFPGRAGSSPRIRNSTLDSRGRLGFRGGRGGRGDPANGLTVISHWTSVLERAAK